MFLLLLMDCSEICTNDHLEIEYVYNRYLPGGLLCFFLILGRHQNAAGIHHKMENGARFLLMECTFHECIKHSRSVYNFILFRATLHSRLGEIYWFCYGLLKV